MRVYMRLMHEIRKYILEMEWNLWAKIVLYTMQFQWGFIQREPMLQQILGKPASNLGIGM